MTKYREYMIYKLKIYSFELYLCLLSDCMKWGVIFFPTVKNKLSQKPL